MKSIVDIINLAQRIITKKEANQIEKRHVKFMRENELEAWHGQRRNKRNKKIQIN
jgi:hypothetical protein